MNDPEVEEAPEEWYLHDKAEGLEPWFLEGALRWHNGRHWCWRDGVWQPWTGQPRKITGKRDR